MTWVISFRSPPLPSLVSPYLLSPSWNPLRINPSLKSHTDLDLFVVPNFPHSITLCTKPPKSFTGFMEMVHETMLKTNGLIVNNFAELDGEECIEHYEKTTGHKAWHLGPVSLIRKSVQEKAERGHESVVGVQECLWWLNSKRHNSVLYMMTLGHIALLL
ncbi:putative flavanone 7-O-beta-glucosyltransferase [Medicago truncatula]|uniref:Putative flavanone 7-O-beta-glucosyltransferase n=1 Tax=Medicago truncatula TaxID=3880 RepID=A0A396IK32_MEDTR|nr:putative flavanone 7-O-beta-glucosyltransferase [Medicago truncatula]